MPTLSKQTIENIAIKLTDKSKKNIDLLQLELKSLVTEIYESQIPDEVKKVFKTHSEYIETTNSLYLDGHGFNREILTMTKPLPSTTSYQTTLRLTPAIADRIMKVKRKLEKARTEYRDLVKETESALLSLKTNKNIRENLPEAAPYLPPPMSNSLVVNFGSLQKKLKSQPEIKKAVAKS